MCTAASTYARAHASTRFTHAPALAFAHARTRAARACTFSRVYTLSFDHTRSHNISPQEYTHTHTHTHTQTYNIWPPPTAVAFQCFVCGRQWHRQLLGPWLLADYRISNQSVTGRHSRQRHGKSNGAMRMQSHEAIARGGWSACQCACAHACVCVCANVCVLARVSRTLGQEALGSTAMPSALSLISAAAHRA